MQTECLNYDLPPELIAQRPTKLRCQSRLLVMQQATGKIRDRKFEDILEYLRADDCLVLNNTRVIPARFFAHRSTGAKLEGLMLGESKPGQWEVMLKNARKIKTGEKIILSGTDKKDWGSAKATERLEDGRWLLEVETDKNAEEVLGEIGFAPLPPYIKRNSNKDLAKMDLRRYQTIYAQKAGAVAAPTAGLHFTTELLEQIKDNGAKLAYTTLHVGAGTFKPVTTKNLQDHQMHSERFYLGKEDAEVINAAIDSGGRVIAVGTTSTRTLETIAMARKVAASEGSTDLFIQPGYEFKIVDCLVTNFHLPKSTLLALVAAFSGLENVLSAYQHAINEHYRFYSYGDAMLLI